MGIECVEPVLWSHGFAGWLLGTVLSCLLAFHLGRRFGRSEERGP